jgi:hypothetical protein
MTTTTHGLTVPYIVCVERGTLNRGIYDIAVLFDPTSATPWTALSPQPQWNGKVVYSYGRLDRAAAPAVPDRSRTGPTTLLCRAASWSSTKPDRLPLQLEPHAHVAERR